ncbi:hypothetical protein EDC65_0187 [Stella humosa]|uniref:DUF192 domain-containing protein n=1 Tax=Stella humosa TaxID=94 RepID=A0A3N1MD59_9PROT|nr:DUF192 domain-containing protein [Stella humosa]ROQ01015.1 hypothetical protein EDC65_0187 [Stella humosa]BBK31384.1 hypothetical protein STHU_20180 [Stella humosa]
MKTWTRRGVLAAIVAALAAPAVAQLVGFSTSPMTIETADGRRHAFTVELALTDAQQTQGLMYRRSLAPDRGMLFVYPVDAPLAMWMKNTYIPLDMLFLRADGTIINIIENVPPQTLDSRPSEGPARGAVELAAGTAARLGIRAGDRVIHERLGGR